MSVNQLWIRRGGAAGVCGLLAFGAIAQGPLTPPGAPAATMKTLGQLEPRTAISNANYTISQPGSYYLTTNLTATGHGITISADNVTLDLNGFSLTGDLDTGDYGIQIGGNFSYKNIAVRNGAISRFHGGLYLQRVSLSRFDHLSFSTNRYGIRLAAATGQSNGNRFSDCRIADSAAMGVYLQAWDASQCNGNLFAGCTIMRNAGGGVYFLTQDSSRCDGNQFSGCRVVGNGMQGFVFSGPGSQSGNLICDCTISDNTYSGVYFNGQNGKCDGNRLFNCVLSRNGGKGVSCEGTVGNRIENNVVSDTAGSPSYGIQTTTSSNNLVIRNVCSGQTSNYDIDADDSYGPIVTLSGALATNGLAAHPWANFSR